MTRSSRPNLLVVMADQLGALSTSPYGNADVLTPNLEALARAGVVFERAYCNSPLCAPSRASMMAGTLPGAIPVNDNGEEMPASVPTICHHLRAAGYLTVLSGKMHFVGPDQLHGFEERLTSDVYPSELLWVCNWEPVCPPPELEPIYGTDPMPWRRERAMARRVRDAGPAAWTTQMDYDEEAQAAALRRLRELGRRRGADAERPWFLCVSFTQPHDPYLAPRPYWDRYEGRDIALPEAPSAGRLPHVNDRWVNWCHGVDKVLPSDDDVHRTRRGSYAMTSYVDDKLGELVAELDRFSLVDDTVVIFTADHGDMLGEHGMFFKRTVRERSARVPLIVSGPGAAAGRRCRRAASLVDVMPTVLDLAGVEPRIPLPEEGGSLVPWLRGEDVERRRGRVVIENNAEGTLRPVRAVVEGDLKLVYTHGYEDQLFDLARDPDERHDVVGDPAYAGALASLRRTLFDGWDPDRVEADVKRSQARRRFLREALGAGRHHPWDYQPFVDASRQWVRRPGPDGGRSLG